MDASVEPPRQRAPGSSSIRRAQREPARFTLRITITLSILAITVITAASLLALAQRASHSALSRFSVVLLDPVAALVGDKTRDFLSTVERAAQLNREVVESTGAGVEHFDAIEQQWLSILATDPDVYYLQFGDAPQVATSAIPRCWAAHGRTRAYC